MAEFAYGMASDIEMSATLDGTATDRLSDLRRLRTPGIKKQVSITALVSRPGGRQAAEPFQLPAIVDGDATSAKEQLDRLVNQSRIDANMERRLDDMIAELERITAP